MTSAYAEIINALEPAERAELDEHLIALSTNQPHVEYQQDPIGWAVDKLGVPRETIVWSLNEGYASHQWDGTPDPLVQICEALVAWQDAGAESATGTGKSFWGAVLTLWFLACWENALVFTFAPKEDQLKKYIWKEIGKLWPRFQPHFPAAVLTSLQIRMRGDLDETWAASGFSVGVVAGETISSKASGMHAEHMLLIYEETQGQPMPVLEAGENTCTAPHNIRFYIGNPNHKLDTLHRACTSPGVRHVRMSALDHPNVVTGRDIVPGACSRASNQRRLRKYGETSPVYRSRIRGISPDQASDALIRMEWLEASHQRYEALARTGRLPRRVTGKGVDVANSEHGDRACIVDFAANVVIRVDAFQCPDANQLGRKVSMEIDSAELKSTNVGVDTIGVGAGTFNELHRLKKRVQGLNASSKPVVATEAAPDGSKYSWIADGNVFRTQRDQWYWQLREDLRLGRIDMQRDDELWEELVEPTFVDEPKTIVEAKEEVKDRLGRSPDKADALVMANWVRERRAPAMTEQDPRLVPGHDPLVSLTTKDGKPPRWVGPEGREDDFSNGYASQFPVNI